jgi:hypothetical protein
MEAKKRNQKLVLVGLLMGLLAMNIPWEQYFNVNWNSAADLASMTQDAQNMCQIPEGKTYQQMLDEYRSSGNRTHAPILQAFHMLRSNSTYSFDYALDDNPTVYGFVDRSERTEDGFTCNVTPGAFEDCPEGERTPTQRTIKTFRVDLSRTGARTSTEADIGVICRGDNCPETLGGFDITINGDASTSDQVHELCWKFQLERSQAYYKLLDENKIYNTAQREAAIADVAGRLEELQKECKANNEYRPSDNNIEDSDMAEFLAAFNWDAEEAISQLNTLADLDLDGEGLDDDDVHETIQDIAITERRDFVSCHKDHMRGLNEKEEDQYFHDNLLDKYREWMVSSDEETRDYAYASLNTWQERSGFSDRFRRFLRSTEYRGKRSHAYTLQLENLDADYERLRARYAGNPSALQHLDTIYDGVRASAEQQYRADMHNSLAGLPRDSDILAGAMDFWGDHADGIVNDLKVDDSIVNDLDFDALARTQIENPQRFSRWEYSRGNNVSERIEEIMAGALRDSNRMLDRFNGRDRTTGGTSLDRFRLNTEFAGGSYPRYNAPPSTNTRNRTL